MPSILEPKSMTSEANSPWCKYDLYQGMPFRHNALWRDGAGARDRPDVVQLPLCRDQGLQGNAVWDHKRRAALLDKTLLPEIREKPADRLSRRADHLPDLFVSRRQLHLAGVSGFSVLVEPSHQQSSKLFAG